MFVRYLSGGIGHLEQFPPAKNDDNDTGAHNDGDLEAEMDDFIVPGDTENDSDSDDSEEGGEMGEDEDIEDEDNLDPGELSDEETGNVY